MSRCLVLAGLIGAASSLALSAGPVSAGPTEQDTMWMVAAHHSNLAEIAAGNAAVAQASNDTVRSLGQMFVTMHTQLDADLTAAAAQLGVTVPDEPTPSQQSSLAAVQAQQDAAFDTAWITDQIAAHRTTLQATQVEHEQGTDPTVVALANAASPVVQQHLADLEAAAGAIGVPAQLAATGPTTATATALLGGVILLIGSVLAGPARATRRRAA